MAGLRSALPGSGRSRSLDLVFAFDNGRQVEPHEHQITFRPVTISDLRQRLGLAGLREVDTNFDDSHDRYAVITVTI
jgi:hypothetical protein